MAGWLTDGVPLLTQTTGAETFQRRYECFWRCQFQMGAVPCSQLANLISFYNNGLSKTMVAARFITRRSTSAILSVLTGLSVLVGATGGTDNWDVGLYSSAGALLATSVLTGTVAGTAATWEQIPFTATYNLTVPGTYFTALQSNGTTATFNALNSDTSPIFTGSKTGAFGTWTSITPPTTYTANLGRACCPTNEKAQ